MAAILMPNLAPVPAVAVVAVTPEAQAEYEAFFIENYAATVRLLMSMGTSAEQAQDATQEAFIRLYTRWFRLRRHDSPEAWVRRVAINRARDLHRSDARRANREVRSSGRAVDAPGVDAAVISGDETRRLLLELPRRQRTIAALFYIDDMSVNDIAAFLGLSTGAVKFHLNRARKSLRAVIDSEDTE